MRAPEMHADARTRHLLERDARALTARGVPAARPWAARARRAAWAAFASATLAACGGGGGGGGDAPAPSGPAYALRSAMTAFLKSGWSLGFSVSGSCHGSATQVGAPATPASFGGTSGYAVVASGRFDLVDCLPSTIATQATDYYDASYTPIGVVSDGVTGIFGAPQPLPEQVREGESGSLGRITYYADAQRTQLAGYDDVTYVVEPDGASSGTSAATVIFNRITRSYDAAGIAQQTEQDRFRLLADGTLRVVSSELVAQTGTQARLLLTAVPDTTPPTVVSTAPAHGATNVPVTTNVVLAFSEPIDATSVTGASLVLRAGASDVAGTVAASATSVTFTPAASLAYGTTYTLTLAAGVRDRSGNAMPASGTWSFTTGPAPDTTPPAIASRTPAPGDAGVPTGTTIAVQFSEAIDPASVTASTFEVRAGATLLAGTASAAGTTATFTPASTLAPATVVTVTLHAGVRDASGNAIGTDATWSFTTASLSAAPPLARSVSYQGDYAHSGFVTWGAALGFPATPTWSVTLPGAASYPVFAGGKVFVTSAATGGAGGTLLHALDAQTGALAWGPVAIGGTYPWSGLAVDQGRVSVVSSDGRLRSFDADTGAPQWSVQLPGQSLFSSPPTAVNGVIYVAGSGVGGTLYAVAAGDGRLLWQASVATGDHSSPAVAGNGVYVAYPCQVYRFDASTGALRWVHSSGCSGGGGRTVVVENGAVHVRDVGTSSGLILDAATGTPTGSFASGTTTPIPAFGGGTELLLAGGALQAIDAVTRVPRWSFAGDGGLSSAPFVIDQTVVAGSSSGTLYALDLATGATLWTGAAGAGIPAPDEINVSQPLTGLGAGDGVLVVPAGNVLTGWRLLP